MKKLSLILSCSLALLLWPVSPAHAQELNYQCIGKGLADYMNSIIAGAGNLSHVKLLSPAFNMTSYTFDDIVNAMGTNGAKFDKLSGIAGNVYNTDNRRITSWLDEKLVNSHVSGKPLYLTETGEKDVADNKIPRYVGKDRLKEEFTKLKSPSNKWHVQASVLFNVFNNSSKFSSFSWDKTELNYICGGLCVNAGANSASYFNQDDNYSLYQDASDTGMNYVVEIANNDQSAAQKSVRRAFEKGLTPIIRVGVGDNGDGFENTKTYIDFLTQLNSYISVNFSDRKIYAIAGPNEPDTEFWAAPKCKTTQLPAKKGPLEEGFNPQNSSLKNCDQTTDSEYHPLRPYPGNPCDPLIPRSIPEAPVQENKKFNTFACGTSLTPSTIERFDAYGQNGYYESLDFGYGSAHTICDPVPEDSPNGTTVNCWRSEVFDITLDLSKANLGILGNTQDVTLTDEQKVNEYLSWYLTGTPQIGDQIPLSSKNPADINRLVNFSGPLRKLMPYDLTNLGKNTLAKSNKQDVHNYLAGCGKARNLITEVAPDILSALSVAAGSVSNLGNIATDIVTLGFTNISISISSLNAGMDFQAKTFNVSTALSAFSSQITDSAQINAFLSLAQDISSNAFDTVAKIVSAIDALNSIEFAKTISCDTTANPADQRRLQDYAGLAPSWIYNLNPYSQTVNDEIMRKLLQNVPFSSLEDTAGEVTVSVFRDPTAEQQTQNISDPVSRGSRSTAPLKLIIKKAELAK